MNKSVKMILLVVGIGLLVYGIYTLIAPEASVSLGGLSMEAQDNTNSYIRRIGNKFFRRKEGLVHTLVK